MHRKLTAVISVLNVHIYVVTILNTDCFTEEFLKIQSYKIFKFKFPNKIEFCHIFICMQNTCMHFSRWCNLVVFLLFKISSETAYSVFKSVALSTLIAHSITSYYKNVTLWMKHGLN